MAAVVAAAADKLFLGYLRSPEKKKAVKRKVDEFEIGVRSEREHCSTARSTHNTQQSQSRREKSIFQDQEEDKM